MQIQPLHDKVVIQTEEKTTEVKTDSGLYLNAEAQEAKGKKQGRVVAVGPGAWNEGGDGRRAMTVKKGDTVLYSWGDSVEHEGVSYDIVSESNVLAIIST